MTNDVSVVRRGWIVMNIQLFIYWSAYYASRRNSCYFWVIFKCICLVAHAVSSERPNTGYGFRNRNQKMKKNNRNTLSTRCRDNEEEDEDARGESLIKFLIIQMCSVVVGVYTRIHCDNSLIIIFAFNRRCLQCSLHWNLHLHRAHTKCARCPTARTIAVARENRSEEERKPTETNSALIRRYCEWYRVLINLAIEGANIERAKKKRSENIILWNYVRNYMCRPPNQLTPLASANCRSRRERPRKWNCSLAIVPHHKCVQEFGSEKKKMKQTEMMKNYNYAFENWKMNNGCRAKCVHGSFFSRTSLANTGLPLQHLGKHK